MYLSVQFTLTCDYGYTYICKYNTLHLFMVQNEIFANLKHLKATLVPESINKKTAKVCPSSMMIRT